MDRGKQILKLALQKKETKNEITVTTEQPDTHSEKKVLPKEKRIRIENWLKNAECLSKASGSSKSTPSKLANSLADCRYGDLESPSDDEDLSYYPSCSSSSESAIEEHCRRQLFVSEKQDTLKHKTSLKGDLKKAPIKSVPNDDTSLNKDVSSASTSQVSSQEEPYMNTGTEKGAIRKRRKEIKMYRSEGKQYVTSKGRVFKEKQFIPLETCSKRCKEKISVDEQKQKFNTYWAITKSSDKFKYLESLITIKTPSYEVLTDVTPKSKKKKEISVEYNIELSNGVKIRVCKKCFIQVFSITDRRIRTVANTKRKGESFINRKERRGTNCKNKVSTAEREEIQAHIQSFPIYESHYTRKKSKKKYLAPHLTVRGMYANYKESKETKARSLTIYQTILQEMGIKFKQPKADTCNTCDEAFLSLKCCSDNEKRLAITSKLHDHQTKAENAYAEKAKDKQLSIDNPSIKTFAFDLQQCLPTPDLTTNVVFYKRQLWTFNLTIHDLATSQGTCYMWHEGISGRGANQIGSCLFHFLKQLSSEIKQVILYSDTCTGQNKNSHISSMFLVLNEVKPSIKILEHKFLVPGHTHMECDTDHSIIEKARKRRLSSIWVPEHWMQLVEQCKKTQPNLTVVRMTEADFYDFAGLLKTDLQYPKLVETKSIFKWKSVCYLRYEPNNERTLQFKTSFSTDETFCTADLQRRRKEKTPLINALKNITEIATISKEKKKDLLSMLSFIHPAYHAFYQMLREKGSLSIFHDPDLDSHEENESDDE